MANCDDTLRELETFLDGELDEPARQLIHLHLGGCVDCLETFDFHAELRVVIAERCRNDALPPGLLERIERCFERGDTDR